MEIHKNHVVQGSTLLSGGFLPQDPCKSLVCRKYSEERYVGPPAGGRGEITAHD